jgi:hypothetical protein
MWEGVFGKEEGRGGFTRRQPPPLLSCLSPLAGKMTDREFVAWLGVYRPRYTYQRENGIDADGAFFS